MTANVYSPPQSPLSDPVDEKETEAHDDISLAELTAFTGKSGYPEQLLPFHRKARKNAGFNFWAALFGVQWFVFRKLYIYALIAFGLEAGIPLILGLIAFSISATSDRTTIAIIVIAGIVAARFAIGYFANMALCWKAVKSIRAVDALNLDNEMHLRLISQAGGVSVPSLVLVYVAAGVFRIVIESMS
ncbi:DUF2628 domain-containing protein [Niveibacterium sp. COAC-50]|uniref:DUF2628 domain-containing protein n=1 Tax=Niveibacterium sp. COAC-50 TaxID=2729384 RepID=UPI0015574322|nr:DUF2628 domain-containing protein [Niveibacterium sp. COAC-50]